MTRLTRLAPAKLNLGLHVLRRRDDGFRQLETVFLPIGWADELAAEPSSTLELTTSDPALPTDDGNLVVRAASALADHAGVEPTGRFHLDKRVPYGAGLGSGSSDAAATLRLCVELWDLDVSEADLHAIASSLGSDVPFFLLEGAAHATGRGEVLTPLRGDDGQPYRCPFWIVVVVSEVHVSTAEAYALVQPSDVDRPDIAVLVRSNDLASWREELVNDFEAPIAARHPEIASALATLREHAGYAAMSGSGSAVFGVFETEVAAKEAASALRDARVWIQSPDVNPQIEAGLRR
ncbi:MAG: 4-(cytidine 5'-diphospho)-2-C-methyl-D-erythritol kinase [Bacteroidota bacterium]